MDKQESNVYEFDPKKRRRPRGRSAGDRSGRKGYENLVRNRRLKAFAVFLVIVAAYVLARPVLSGLTLGR